MNIINENNLSKFLRILNQRFLWKSLFLITIQLAFMPIGKCNFFTLILGDYLMTDVEISPNFTGFNNAKYAFTLFPTRRIANSDTIEIRFAPQILLQDGKPVCSISSLSDATLKLTSCVSIGNVILIQISSTTANISDFIVTITIETLIRNPFSVFNDPTVVNIKEQSGNIRDSNTSLVFNFSPAEISSLTIENLNKNPGEITDLVYKFTPVFPVLLGASLRLDFPYFNENAGAPVNQIFSVLMSINGGTFVSEITGLNPTLNFKANYSSSQLYLFSINNPSTLITSECSFKISNIVNPLSLSGKSGFSLSILDQNSNVMQQSKLLTIKPSTFSDVTNLSIIPSLTAVSRMANFNFIFQTRNYKGKDFILEIIFPSEFQNLDKNQIKISGVSKLNLSSFLNFDLTARNKIRITNAFNQYYIGSDIHNLRIAGIRNPFTTKKTSTFAFNVYENSGSDLFYSLKREVTLTPSAGIFLENLITPENLSINKQTKYSLTFSTDSFILKNSSFVIAFPPEINLIANADGSCSLSGFTGIAAGALPNFNSALVQCVVTSDNKAVISNLFQADFLQTQSKFGFVLESVKNPSFAKDAFLFGISLNAADGNAIDFFSGNVPLNFSNGEISLLAFSAENKNVNALNSFSFDLSLQNEISGDSMISLELPVEFRFLDDLISKVEISVFNFDKNLNAFDMQKPVFFSLGNNVGNNNNNNAGNVLSFNFKKENFVISVNAKIRISIKNIINPRSNKAIQITNIKSFILITLNNSLTAYAVDSLNNPIKFDNLEVAENTQFTLLPRESVTGKLTSYSLSVKPLSQIYSGDSLMIKLPSVIQLTSNTNAIGASPNLNASLDFALSSITNENLENVSIIKITLAINTSSSNNNNNKNFIAETETFAITLNNIINPISTEPAQIAQIQILTAENFLVENSQKKLSLSVETPNLIQNASIKPVQSFIGGASDYLIEFTTSNLIFKDSQIKIFYPKEISIVDPKCSGLQGIQSDIICVDDSVSRIFIVKNGFQKDQQASNIKFKIAQIKNNLKAPQIKTETFKIVVETKSGFLTDAVFSNLNLTFLCNFPCKSCLQDTITCLACESAQGQILHNGTCVSKCPSGFYYTYNSDPDKNQCKKCSESCSSCAAENPNICTACPADKPLFILESNFCTNRCPDGFYADLNNKQCFKCDASCKTCGSSKSSCLSCFRGFALFERESRCLADCPQNISILIKAEFNSNTNTNNSLITDKCVSCDGACATCKENVGNCLSCAQGFAFFEGKCLAEQACPQGTIALSGKCAFCDDKCEICKDNSDLSLCRKCKDGFVLGADSKCYVPVNACEKGFFNSEGVCYKCDSNCESCSVEAGFCTSCPQGLLLQGRSCVENCAESFYKKSERECAKCDSACKACVNQPDNCLHCIKGMKLFVTKDVSACINACPDGFFSNGLLAKKFRYLAYSAINNYNNNHHHHETEETFENIKEFNDLFNPKEETIFNYSAFTKNKFLKNREEHKINYSTKSRILTSDSNSIVSTTTENNPINNNNNSNNNSQNKSECSPCLKNCRTCSDYLSCLRCELGFYLYNKSKCLKFCPDNYFENSQNAQCELIPDSKGILLPDGTYSKKLSNSSGKTTSNLFGVINNNYMCKNCDYTYTFLFIFLLGFFAILLLKCLHNEMHFFGTILGFSSVFIFSLNIYLVKIVFNFGIKFLFYLVIIKFLVNYLLNYFFVLRLSFLIRSADKQFSYWTLNNRIKTLFYLLAGLFIDYKIIRLVYSRFKIFKNSDSLSKKNCLFCFEDFFNAKFADVENINKPFKHMLIADIMLTDSLIFLICLFVFFNFYFSPEILKLAITVFSIYLIVLIVKVGELIVFIAADDFYNQRKLSTVDVKPYISNDKNSSENKSNYQSESENEKIKKKKLINFNENLKNQNLKNKFLSEENNLNEEEKKSNCNNNNIGYYSSKITSNSKNKSNNLLKKNLKLHNSVCFNNENNLAGLNLNLKASENPQKKKLESEGKYLQQQTNFSGNYNNENTNWYKYRLNNSGGVYELEKYANCNLSKEFNLNNNANNNNNINNKEEENNQSCSARRDFECRNNYSESNGNYFNYSDFDRKCKSLFTKRNNENNFNLNSESRYNNYYCNNENNNNWNKQEYQEDYDCDYIDDNNNNESMQHQQEINFKSFYNDKNNNNKAVNNFINSQQSNNKNSNSSKIKGAYTDLPRRHTFSRLSIHNKNNIPQSDKNSEENKDQHSSNNYNNQNENYNSNYKYAVNDEKAIQNFSSKNQTKKSEKNENTNSNQNTIKNNKISFFQKLTSSIKNIFPSTKKTQKHLYCVVQEENQVSCFNNKKINTFKAAGTGLENRLAHMSVENNQKNKEGTLNNRLEGGIESTPNFNTNPSDVYYNFYNYNNNNYNETEINNNADNSNVWGFNEARGPGDNFSVSHRTNTADLSDVDLLKRRKN